METARNFVGGSLDDALVKEEIDVPDPATRELLGRVPISGPEDVDRDGRGPHRPPAGEGRLERGQRCHGQEYLHACSRTQVSHRAVSVSRENRSVEHVDSANNARRIVT